MRAAIEIAERLESFSVRPDCAGEAAAELRRLDRVNRMLIEGNNDTSAMLAVLLEDVWETAPDSAKRRICMEIANISRRTREAELTVRPK